MKSFLLIAIGLGICSYSFSQKVGIGTVTPAFKLDVVNGSINTDSVYRIGTFTVLSVLGTNNLFAGQHAGKNNSGIENTFTGAFSGRFNTNGFLNSFYGTGAGYNNIGGFYNSFFGAETGFNNTDGKDNSFFGMQAGITNTTGSSNSFFGRSSGALNSIGKSNSIFGMSAGFSNDTGNNNSFFGDSTGFQNNTGTDNTFMGKLAGFSNTNGNSNSFFGKKTGFLNNTGYSNSFFGQTAGYLNTSGFENSFFGFNTGVNNYTGFENSFFGSNTGLQNFSGNKNSFFGKYAGYGNISGTNNTSIGYSAFFNSGALTNATSIGSNARVDCNNCMVLGSVNGINGAPATVNVGIGTTSPNARLDVNGTLKLADGTQGAGKILTSDATGLASWQPPPPAPPTYYQSVSICCQSWMTNNLNVTEYRNGDPIPKVTDETEWGALTSGAYCYHLNDSATYAATYGKLYNWYAVNDPRGLAPQGWHIPTDFEWTTLGTCLGGDAVAGGPMKEIGTTHWTPPPNYGATNLSGFTALPGGYRDDAGSFYGNVDFGIWWSSTENELLYIWYRSLSFNNVELSRNAWPKSAGFSVRCLKD
jgi:uncharacterized protein (TIGR02145 family)